MTRYVRRPPLSLVLLAGTRQRRSRSGRSRPPRRTRSSCARVRHVSVAARRPRRTNPASWSYLGPTNISGRATDMAVADKNGQRRIYVGYATSGVWKTDDNGTTWQAIFEHMPSTSIGDIAVAPSNPDIVWVGTGEANIFRASMAGRRHLQVHRRRPDLAAHGPDRHADDRAHRRASDESRHRVRRRLRPRVDRQRDARRVQDDRRRHARGRRCSTRARAPARSISSWIRAIRTRSTRRCGSASAASGAIRASSPATTKAAS